MNRPANRRAVPSRGRPPASSNRGLAVPIVAVAIGLVVLLAVVAIVVSGGDDDGTATDVAQVAPVSIEGAPLPELATGVDPAVGTPAPTVRGSDFDGGPVVLGGGGRPTLAVFLAHWCPHCQREVPVLVDWMATSALADEVDVVAVATATTDARENFPPSAWLEREGWPTPVLVDSERFETGAAYGLSAYPFMVALDADGVVVARTSGELSTDQLDALVSLAIA